MIPLHDANPRHGPSFVNYVFIIINVVVFAYMAFGLQGAAVEEFVMSYAFVPNRFFAEPVAYAHTLVTSVFLHGGLAHILGNMVFLYVFGDNIEDRMGHGTFLVWYLVGGVLATLAYAFFAPDSNVPLVGASGAVSAVLGAYIVLFPGQRVLAWLPPFFLFWLPAWFFLGYWALIQTLQAAGGLMTGDPAAGGVAWLAHVGGFVFGMVTVKLLAAPPRARSRSKGQFAGSSRP